MDCSSPGSSVQGIFQARILEWVTMPSSRGSSQPRDRTHVPYVSCIWQVSSLSLVPAGKPGCCISSILLLYYGGWGGDFLFSWSRLFPPTDNMCRNSLDPILFHLYLWQLFYVCSEPGVQTGVTRRALNIRGLARIMGRHQLYWGRGPGPPAATLVSLWISCVETTFLCWASITWLWLPLQPKHCCQMSSDHVIYLRERELPEGRSYALQHHHPGGGLGECSDSDISY